MLILKDVTHLPWHVQAKFLRLLEENEFERIGDAAIVKVNLRTIGVTGENLFQAVLENKFRMDEISNLPLDTQAKFMRVLQDGEVRPVGSNKTYKIDVRIISACSIPLHQLVKSQKFRELENFVERLVKLAAPPMETLDHDHLPPDLQKEMKKLAASRQPAGVVKPLYESLAEYEEQLIRQALNGNNWNIPQTARVLRIAAQTLRNKMIKRGIIKRHNNLTAK